ncbi:MAG: acyl-CoA thioesterase, partial [Pseudomonadota bacterium]
MNLFFRLLRIFLSSLFAGKHVGLLTQTTLNFRVWITDQDMFMHMTNSRYLSFGDLGTINYILRTGSWTQLRKRGWFPVICGQTMIISRMMAFPQKFELRSRVTGWDDAYVGLLHEFYSKGRKTAEVKVVAKFASTDRKTVAPDDMVALVDPGAVNPGLDQDFQDLIERIKLARS